MANENDHISIATTDVLADGSLVVQVRPELISPEPDKTPFQRFQESVGIVTWKNITRKIQWEWPHKRWLDVTASSAAAANIVVDDYTPMSADQVWHALDADGGYLGFTIRIGTTPSSTTISSLTRPFGGTDATIPANGHLELEGQALTENDLFSPAVMRNIDQDTQRLGIQNRPWETSWIVESSVFYHGSESVRVEASGVREFSRDNEIYYLQSHEVNESGSANAKINRTKGAVRYAEEWNPFDCGGTLTSSLFIAGVQQCNRYGTPRDKSIFVPNEKMVGFSQWPVQANIARQDAMRKQFGFEVNVIVVPGLAGNANLIPHHLFEGKNELYIHDADAMSIAQQQGKGVLRIHRDLQANDATKTKAALFWVTGIEMREPWTIGVFKNADEVAA